MLNDKCARVLRLACVQLHESSYNKKKIVSLCSLSDLGVSVATGLAHNLRVILVLQVFQDVME